jgi:uncharacterized membrane protein required for colicin V production
MGLDVTLAVFVLLAGIRGWLKGFVRQGIGIAALIGCVYLADPVRDETRPYVQSYFPSIRPELFEKMLWWTSAVACYVLMAGIALWIVKAYRRKPYGEPEPNRGDQGGGFAMGLFKGLIIASFLTAALTKYDSTISKVTGGTWVEEQIKSSQALAWSAEYKPAERLWNAPPVQAFVARVRSRGLWNEPTKSAEAPPIQTASSPPRTLIVPPPPAPLDPASPDFLREVDESMRKEGIRNSR